MNKSLEKIRDIKSLINEVYQDELNEGARKSWLVFQQYCDDIKQDLELLEQLKQQRDSLAINNGELCVKVCKLEKALDKACEKFDFIYHCLLDTIKDLYYVCPTTLNLIDDLERENKCWKKYFLNLVDAEVLE